MRRMVVVAMAAVAVLALGLGACGAVVTSAVTSGASTGVATARGPGPGFPHDGPVVPAGWEALEQRAAATCNGLDWAVLAAIGRVESDSGRSTLPGVASGANASGAEGPMQFEPATFAQYAVVGPGGATPPSPYDPVDAVYTAAHMLCEDGVASEPFHAVWDYDHSVSYVETVLVLARAIGADPVLGSVPATAVAFAAHQLGVPYRWGGTGPGGYDCSGLVQAAYRSAGVALPRVAQTQFDAGPRLAPGAALEPGDLVFFGRSATGVSHVGLYIGTGDMIDAPHTGTVVRIQATPTDPGAPWGTDVVIGETRPSPG